MLHDCKLTTLSLSLELIIAISSRLYQWKGHYTRAVTGTKNGIEYSPSDNRPEFE